LLLACAHIIVGEAVDAEIAPVGVGAWPTYGRDGVDWRGGVCGSRERQSPVNFERLLKYPPQDYLDYHYEPIRGPLEFKAAGGMLVADVGQVLRGGVEFGREFYPLQAIHFHGPAEHLIAGKRNPLEMQLMHRSFKDPQKTVIVSMLIWSKATPLPPPMNSTPAFAMPSVNEYGFNPHLQNFLKAPPPTTEGASSSLTVDLDLSKLVEDPAVPDSGSYFSYAGSLTTPPCIDHASWFVRRRIVLASSQQVKALSDALYAVSKGAGSNRDIAPWNRRIVRIYKVRNRPYLTVGGGQGLPWGPNPRTDGEMEAHKLAKMARDKAENAAYYVEDFARRLGDADRAFAHALRGSPAAASPQPGQSPEDRQVAYQQAVRAVREAIQGATRQVKGAVDAVYRAQAQGLYGAVAQLHQQAADLVNNPPNASQNVSAYMSSAAASLGAR